MLRKIDKWRRIKTIQTKHSSDGLGFDSAGLGRDGFFTWMLYANNDLSLFVWEASFKSFEIDNVVESKAKSCQVGWCYHHFLLSNLKHLWSFSEYFGVVVHIRIVSNAKAFWKEKKKKNKWKFKMCATNEQNISAQKLRNYFGDVLESLGNFILKIQLLCSIPSRKAVGAILYYLV